MEPYIDDKGRPYFIPFDPRNGYDFKCIYLNPETLNYELRENGELKILTPEEFKKLKLIMAPNVKWIIRRYSNGLSYRYDLEMEKEREVQNGNG